MFTPNQQLKHEPGSGMGTTLVGLYLPSPTQQSGLVFNVGDSRLYHYRNAQLAQLTEDQTLLREWQQGQQRGPAPPGNIIMRGIGLFETVEIDITPIGLQSDDIILICSDGLSDMLSDTELAEYYLAANLAAWRRCVPSWSGGPTTMVVLTTSR